MQERYKVQHGPPRTLCPVATSPSKLLSSARTRTGSGGGGDGTGRGGPLRPQLTCRQRLTLPHGRRRCPRSPPPRLGASCRAPPSPPPKKEKKGEKKAPRQEGQRRGGGLPLPAGGGGLRLPAGLPRRPDSAGAGPAPRSDLAPSAFRRQRPGGAPRPRGSAPPPPAARPGPAPRTPGRAPPREAGVRPSVRPCLPPSGALRRPPAPSGTHLPAPGSRQGPRPLPVLEVPIVLSQHGRF